MTTMSGQRRNMVEERDLNKDMQDNNKYMEEIKWLIEQTELKGH